VDVENEMICDALPKNAEPSRITSISCSLIRRERLENFRGI
jgi:hypothetical protein